ncbi:MAG TPA: hypothetical protein VIM41_03780 [Gammaproteobacteria bacterium]
MELVDTFDFHRCHPEQSIEDYYRSLRLDLSQEMVGKKVVYLDTKFWVILRDGYLDPTKNQLESKLLNLTLDLSAKKVCVFPISEDLFLEILKQTDIKTLKATVELIDKLSNGISSISYDDRIKLEIMQFWYSTLGKNVYETKELVWTKLAYNMGLHSFEIPQLSTEENRVLQKAFIDQMWSISMSQMIEVMLENGGLTKLEFAIANKLNEGKYKHQDEARSFNQMFLNEVGGIVDVYRDALADMMEFMYQKETGENLTQKQSTEHRDETKRVMGNTIYNLFRLNKVGKAMPFIRISSALHASVRWDKKQKFQDHDFHDFRHATTALPYCDYFFTEKRLAHLLTQKQLGFEKLYKCGIQSKVINAIQSLEKLQSYAANKANALGR